jgi:3-oxoadipate enol-lactonase
MSTNAITTEQHVIERNGCPLHYWLSGSADKPLVVLTHGATLDHRMFDEQLPSLANDYRVLTWDMRGHGLSRPMPEKFTVPGAVDYLLAILDQIGVQRTIFAGQSTGGYVVQEMVFRHPERVIALVMIDCICITLKVSALDSFLLKLTVPLLKMYPYGTLIKQSVEGSSIKPVVKDYLKQVMGSLSRDAYITIWAGVANCLHYEPDYKITQPMLLVHGDHDKLGNIARDAGKWAAREANCTFAIIPNAGHCSNQDNPAFFNKVLLDFLKTINPNA